MLLSEIAEKIIKKESNLSLENEVIVGNREEWYEESLIDPLIDYYSYDVLRLCGCGRYYRWKGHKGISSKSKISWIRRTK